MDPNVNPIQPDTKAVNEIVDQLKKQGLFDRFRKECLADIDTKPAYLNLKHRVEGFVARFLSGQEWTPDLNKNHLRNNLRKQLTESPMLSTGIDRVIEQVVNPKIYKDFSPEIDKIVCIFLGLDNEKWQKKLQMRDEFKRRKQQEEQSGCDPQNSNFGQEGYVPNLMEMGYQQQQANPGTSYMNDAPNIHSNMTNTMATGTMNQMTSNIPAGISSMNYPQGQYGQSGMNYGFMSPTQGQGYNMPPGYPGTNFGSPPGMPPVGPYGSPNLPIPMPGMPGYGIPGFNQAAMGLLNMMNPMGMQAPPTQTQAQEEKKEKKEKVVLEPLTVESLINVGVPKQEEHIKKESEVKKSTEDKVIKSEDSRDMDNRSESQGSEKMELDSDLSDHGETVQEEIAEQDQDSNKVYHFSWQTGGNVSDVTVSSVHTSDLSSFEESDSDGESVASKMKEELLENEENKPSIQGSPEKPPKPRKLLALSYNYSDSDDETREERKARIAQEKADRYQKRLQRRAELEAKRKEREGERAMNRERKKKAKEEKVKMPERENEMKAEQKERIPPLPEKKKEEKTEDLKNSETLSPSKKGRKSKQEMKEQLREQKLMEKRMSLRRQRTKNRKYFSEEYETTFREKKQMFSDSYQEVVEIEEVSQMDYTEGINIPGGPSTPTQDEPEEEQLAHNPPEPPLPPPPHITRSRSKRMSEDKSDSRPSTPYSDISEDSKADSISDVRVRRSARRKEDKDSLERRTPEINERRPGRRGVNPPEPETQRPSTPVYDESDAFKTRSGVRRRASSPTGSSRSISPRTRTSLGGPDTPDKDEEQTLESKVKTQRYDTSDLYKPHQPSSRASRYQSRASPESREDSPESEKRSKTPIHQVNFGMAAKKTKKPVDYIDFGEAARRASQLPGSARLAQPTPGRGMRRGVGSPRGGFQRGGYQRGGFQQYQRGGFGPRGRGGPDVHPHGPGPEFRSSWTKQRSFNEEDERWHQMERSDEKSRSSRHSSSPEGHRSLDRSQSPPSGYDSDRSRSQGHDRSPGRKASPLYKELTPSPEPLYKSLTPSPEPLEPSRPPPPRRPPPPSRPPPPDDDSEEEEGEVNSPTPPPLEEEDEGEIIDDEPRHSRREPPMETRGRSSSIHNEPLPGAGIRTRSRDSESGPGRRPPVGPPVPDRQTRSSVAAMNMPPVTRNLRRRSDEDNHNMHPQKRPRR